MNSTKVYFRAWYDLAREQWSANRRRCHTQALAWMRFTRSCCLPPKCWVHLRFHHRNCGRCLGTTECALSWVLNPACKQPERCFVYGLKPMNRLQWTNWKWQKVATLHIRNPSSQIKGVECVEMNRSWKHCGNKICIVVLINIISEMKNHWFRDIPQSMYIKSCQLQWRYQAPTSFEDAIDYYVCDRLPTMIETWRTVFTFEKQNTESKSILASVRSARRPARE